MSKSENLSVCEPVSEVLSKQPGRNEHAVNLYAVIYVRNFALQAVLRHTPELRTQAVALIAEKTPNPRILQLTDSAQAAGVAVGMTPAQGAVRCSGLVIKKQSADAERAASAVLSDCALGFSSFVEATDEGICTFRFHEECWAGVEWRKTDDAQKKLPLTHLAALGLSASLGVASNADLALLAAQSGKPFCEVRDARDLALLPIETLDLPQRLLNVLGTCGISTVGAFAALECETLAARFGAEVLPVFKRVSGEIERPLRCIPPPENFEESFEFEHGVETLEPLLLIAHRLLEQIALRLETVWLAAASIELRLGFTIGTTYAYRFQISSPACDVEVLFLMVCAHLKKFYTKHPILSLRLSAAPGKPWQQQFGLFESALRNPHQFFETLARLGVLLGKEHAGTPQVIPAHESGAFFLEPVTFGQPFARQRTTDEPLTNTPLLAGLSLRRCRPARSAHVRFEKQPVFLQSGEASGCVLDAFGPINLSGHWWNGYPWSRNEWDVQLQDGLLCRIYEEGGMWFLDGIYK